AISQTHRLGLRKSWRNVLTIIAAAVAFLWVQTTVDQAAAVIESKAGFVGGFGLPPWAGWLAGGVAAGALGWVMCRITLCLRADDVASATHGSADIVKAFLKHGDRLTRGTLRVSPLPWPVPEPGERGCVLSRSAYLCVTAALIVVIYVLLQCAWA